MCGGGGGRFDCVSDYLSIIIFYLVTICDSKSFGILKRM